MSSDLINLVKNPPNSSFDGYEGNNLDAIRKTMTELDTEFPQELIELLQLSDGGTFVGEHEVFYYYDLDQLLNINTDDLWTKRLPGFLFVGNDNGGYQYVCDTADQLGDGRFAIYMVSMGVMTTEAMDYLGESFYDVFRQIDDGASFLE